MCLNVSFYAERFFGMLAACQKKDTKKGKFDNSSTRATWKNRMYSDESLVEQIFLELNRNRF